MSGYTSPAALPQHVLDREDMQAALRHHDFGMVFKLARKWGGISFLKIADACDIKPERVGKLARGEGAIATYEKITQIADALHIPGRLIGLASRPWESIRAAAQLHPGSPTSVDLEGDDVQRRTFLTASVGVAVLGGEFTGARRVGSHHVEQLRLRTARLRSLDDILGGADTRDLYRSELDGTLLVMKQGSYSETTSKGLLSIAAEQAQQAGWAAFDAGDHPAAVRLYQQAYKLAGDAGDPALAGNSLAFLAYQQVSTGKTGIEAASASCDVAGEQAPPAVRALLHERRAWAYARAGQPRETERALGLAEEALARPETGLPSPDWASWVDDRELQIMKGRCWAELRRPLRAVPALEGALAGFADSHARDKALYLSWLAHAYLDAGEVEESARVITRVVDLSTGVGSVRPQQRARSFLDRLRPHRELEPVAAVLDRARL